MSKRRRRVLETDVRLRESAAVLLQTGSLAEDEQERLVNQAIEAVHCRLLLRGTRGRLTWDGDRIVRAIPIPGARALPGARAAEPPPAAKAEQSSVTTEGCQAQPAAATMSRADWS
jgi:hypothetical protein